LALPAFVFQLIDVMPVATATYCLLLAKITNHAADGGRAGVLFPEYFAVRRIKSEGVAV